MQPLDLDAVCSVGVALCVTALYLTVLTMMRAPCLILPQLATLLIAMIKMRQSVLALCD